MKNNLNLRENGSFTLENVDAYSYLYFPMTNYKGMKSSITPSLGGDAKMDQNSFLLTPVTNEDSHNSFFNRNVYFRVNNEYVWSITGNTPYQMLHKDEVRLEAEILLHKIVRSNAEVQCTIESFVPFKGDFQELHKVTFQNISNQKMTVKPVISIPIYSRSADNIRDHRHVTSLLNKATIEENGIINQPTFTFDERGHNLNNIHYAVFVKSNADLHIKNYWPILEEFIGEGGNLLDPEVVKEDCVSNHQPGDKVSGYELTGGFEYENVELDTQEEITFYISISMDPDLQVIQSQAASLGEESFELQKAETRLAWEKELSTLQISLGDKQWNGWLRWVTLQPILRRIYGCSFLPHHDYGRGGRGWRDLWQDSLALILMNPSEVRSSLLNHFSGVRIDGSNATIIGDQPGEFKADRNNIARVWMDHGAWPYITTMLYVNKSGDYRFLLEPQKYFKDQFNHYTKQVDFDFQNVSHIQMTQDNQEYKGTILEHLLLQNLVPFYNVGEHNNIRIEGADWNDALDMAKDKGESVAFSALYASNLIELGETLMKLNDRGIPQIEVLQEMEILFSNVDFKSVEAKQTLLNTYFDSVSKTVSGKTVVLETKTIGRKLILMGGFLQSHIRNNEWMETEEYSWFNGYYDGDGNRLEDVSKRHMTLTGQVFAIYSGTATYDQICNIMDSADDFLFKEEIGGYILNTDFDELKLNMGRLFGFAYGHKENGAMFSHMAVMFANALYRRNYVKAGNKVLSSIYNHCVNIENSKIYPGIPEYVDPNGRGMYHYLTGSASWYILTMVTEVFGVQADFGQLVLQPKLLASHFNKMDQASIITLINNHPVEIIYNNQKRLNYGDYWIETVFIDDKPVEFTPYKGGIMIEGEITGSKIEVILEYPY